MVWYQLSQLPLLGVLLSFQDVNNVGGRFRGGLLSPKLFLNIGDIL